jgi:hypothetical protein
VFFTLTIILNSLLFHGILTVAKRICRPKLSAIFFVMRQVLLYPAFYLTKQEYFIYSQNICVLTNCTMGALDPNPAPNIRHNHKQNMPRMYQIN